MSTIATDLPTPQPFPQLSSNVLDLFSLKGKVASITGASSGIGYEVAIAFAQAGADVAMWYNSNPKILDEIDELSELYGVKIKAYKCSITDSKQVKETIQKIHDDFGKIDIMVANAGVAWIDGPILDAEDEDNSKWDKIINVDFNSIYYVAKEIGKIFRNQGSGSFIITSSLSAHIVNVPQLQAPYNAAKAGVLHLARSLAVEWAGFARVNTVSPGYIATELTEFADPDLKKKWHSLTPMGREGLPQELIGAYLYLASDASTYMTGSDMRIDGGYSCM